MKRFLLFRGNDYYPSGGWSDWMGAYDTIAEAKREVIEMPDDEWAHIVDLDAGAICLEWFHGWNLDRRYKDFPRYPAGWVHPQIALTLHAEVSNMIARTHRAPPPGVVSGLEALQKTPLSDMKERDTASPWHRELPPKGK